MSCDCDDNILFLHCATCMKQKPKHKSPSEYSRIDVGKTKDGLLIWCKRCDQQVAFFEHDWGDIALKKPCQCERCQKKL